MKKALVELDYFALRSKDIMDAAASMPSTEDIAFAPQPMDSIERAVSIVPSTADITKTEIGKDILPTIVTTESLGSVRADHTIDTADHTIDSADHIKESIKSVGHSKKTLLVPTKKSMKRPQKHHRVKIMDTKVVFVTEALDDTKQAGQEATVTGYNVEEKNVNESAKVAATKDNDKSPAAKHKDFAASGKDLPAKGKRGDSAASGKGLRAKGKRGGSASVSSKKSAASDDSEPAYSTLLGEEDSPEANVTDERSLDTQSSSNQEEVFRSQSLVLPVLNRCNIRGITRPPPHITCFMPYHMVREPLLPRLHKQGTGFPPLVMLKTDPVEEPKVPELGISVSKRDLGFPGPREDDGSELVATEPFLETISSETEIPKGKAIVVPGNRETKGKKPKKGLEDKFSLEDLDLEAEEGKIYSSTIDAVKLKKFQKDLELMASDLTAMKQLQKDTVDTKSRLEEQLCCKQRDPSLRRFDFQTDEHTKKPWGQISDEELFLIRQLAQCLSLTEFCAYINERKLRSTNPTAWKLLQKQDKLQDKFQGNLKSFTSKHNWECEQPDTFQLKDDFDYYSDDWFPMLKQWDKCPSFHDFITYIKEDSVETYAKKKKEFLKKQQGKKRMKAEREAAYKAKRENTGVESDRSVVSSSEEGGRSRECSAKTRDGSAKRRGISDKSRDGSALTKIDEIDEKDGSALTKIDEIDEKDKFKENEYITKGKQSKEKVKELKEKDSESKTRGKQSKEKDSESKKKDKSKGKDEKDKNKDKKSKRKGKQSKGKDKGLKGDESKGRDSGSLERKEKGTRGMRDQHKEVKQKAMAKREEEKLRQSLERTKKQKDKKGSLKAEHKSFDGTKAGKAAKAAKKMMMEELGDSELEKTRSEIGVTSSGTHLLTEEQETLFREARLFLHPDCPWHISVRFAYLVGGVCDSVGMRTGLLKRRAHIYGLLEEIKTILKMNESLLYRENVEPSGSYEEISLKSSEISLKSPSSESLPKPKPSEIKPVEPEKEKKKKGHKKSKPPLEEPETQSPPEAKTKKKKKSRGKESRRSKSEEPTDSELDKRESSKDKHTKRKSDSDDRAKTKHHKKDKQTLDDVDQRESSKDRHAKQESDRDDIAKKKHGKKDKRTVGEKVAEDVESESRQDKHTKQKSDSDDHVKKKHHKKEKQSDEEVIDEGKERDNQRESRQDKHTKQKSDSDDHVKKKHHKKEKQSDEEVIDEDKERDNQRESRQDKHTKQKSDSDDHVKKKHHKKEKQSDEEVIDEDKERDNQRESRQDKHTKQKSDSDDHVKKKHHKKEKQSDEEVIDEDKERDNQRESRQDISVKNISDNDDRAKKKHRKKDRQSLDKEEAGGSDMESGEDQRESYKDTHAKKMHSKKDQQRVEKVAEADDTLDEVLLSEEEAGEEAFSKKGMWKKTIFKTKTAQKLLRKKSIPSESSDKEPTTKDSLVVEARGGEPPSKSMWKKTKFKMLPMKDEKPGDKELDVGTNIDKHKESLTNKVLSALLSGKKVSKVTDEQVQGKKDEETEKTEDAASTQALDKKSELGDDLGLHLLKRGQLRSLFSKEFKMMLFDEMFETSSSDSTISLDFNENFDITQLKKSYSLDNYLASKDDQLLDGRKQRMPLPKSKKVPVTRSKIKLVQSQTSKISVNRTDYLAAPDLGSGFTLRERSPVEASRPPMILGKMREFSFLKYRDYVSGTLNVKHKTEHAMTLEEVCRRLVRAMNVFVVRKERATTTQPFQSKVSVTFTRRESKIASDTLLIADASQIVANVCDTLNENY